MFGWVQTGVSSAVRSARVPYWQQAHSMMRTVTVSGASIVQLPAKGTFEPLRSYHWSVGPTTVVAQPTNGSYAPDVKGDALEIMATFNVATSTATSFGISLRVGGGSKGGPVCTIGYSPTTELIMYEPGNGRWKAGITPQPTADTVQLHIFLDRSIVEVYTGGAALTAGCRLPSWEAGAAAQGIDVWSKGGTVQLLAMDVWKMESMWGSVFHR